MARNCIFDIKFLGLTPQALCLRLLAQAAKHYELLRRLERTLRSTELFRPGPLVRLFHAIVDHRPKG